MERHRDAAAGGKKPRQWTDLFPSFAGFSNGPPQPFGEFRTAGGPSRALQYTRFVGHENHAWPKPRPNPYEMLGA